VIFAGEEQHAVKPCCIPETGGAKIVKTLTILSLEYGQQKHRMIKYY